MEDADMEDADIEYVVHPYAAAGVLASGRHPLGIGNLDEFGGYIDSVMTIPGHPLPGGREAWWEPYRGVIVIRDPTSYHGGTAYRPERGYRAYLDLLEEP
jgi:hypothetical protein